MNRRSACSLPTQRDAAIERQPRAPANHDASPSERNAFSRAELIAVASLTLLLTAVMMPAIAEARARARATGCQDNLKGLGLALLNYEETYASFPPGAVISLATPAESGRGWLSSILPFMGQVPLYEAVQPNGGTITESGDPRRGSSQVGESRELLNTTIRGYRCPEDPLPASNPVRDGFGTSNYSGITGSRPISGPLGFLSVNWPGAIAIGDLAPSQKRQDELPFNGLFTINRGFRPRDILDGMSNTLLVGERSFLSGAGIWAGVRGTEHLNDAMTDCSRVSPLGSPTGLSAIHPGLVNVVAADGHVASLDREIAPGVLSDISTRSGGEVIREPF